MSPIRRLPLHYIILLDQEFITMETWCGIGYDYNHETGYRSTQTPNRDLMLLTIIHTRVSHRLIYMAPMSTKIAAFRFSILYELHELPPHAPYKSKVSWGCSCNGEKITLPDPCMDVFYWRFSVAATSHKWLISVVIVLECKPDSLLRNH